MHRTHLHILQRLIRRGSDEPFHLERFHHDPDLNWTDNAGNEDGYRVYRSLLSEGPFDNIAPDLATNTTTFNDTGLNVNERYYYKVTPFNADGEGLPGILMSAPSRRSPVHRPWCRPTHCLSRLS